MTNYTSWDEIKKKKVPADRLEAIEAEAKQEVDCMVENEQVTDTPAGAHPLPPELLAKLNSEVSQQLTGPRPQLFPPSLYPDPTELVDVTLTPAAVQRLADLGESVHVKIPAGLLQVIAPTGHGLEDLSKQRAAYEYVYRYFARKHEEEDKVKRAGQVTLGQLLALLAQYLETHRDTPVYVELPNEHGDFEVVPIYSMGSYRGYYEDLALEWSTDESPSLLYSFYDDLKQMSNGGLLIGYKGGEYYGSTTTKVWVSRYGRADGWIVTGVTANQECDHPGLYLQVRHVHE